MSTYELWQKKCGQTTLSLKEKNRATSRPDLLYIDLHMVHEVIPRRPLKVCVLKYVRRPDLTIGVEDHNVPTMNINEMTPNQPHANRLTHCEPMPEFGIRLHSLGDAERGIIARCWSTAQVDPTRDHRCMWRLAYLHQGLRCWPLALAPPVEHVLAAEPPMLHLNCRNITGYAETRSFLQGHYLGCDRQDVPVVVRGTCWNTAARLSKRCRWKRA